MDVKIVVAGLAIAAVTYLYGLRAGLAAIIVTFCIFIFWRSLAPRLQRRLLLCAGVLLGFC
jgi:hypothetical protein